MVSYECHELLKANVKPLHEISYDRSNGERMTECAVRAVDFDLVKEGYIAGLDEALSEMPMSVDALLVDGDGSPMLVEFKNGSLDKKDQFKIQKKIFDSMLILSDLLKCHISDTRTFLDFVLVYNEAKNPRVEIAEHFAKKARTVHVRFGLEIFRKYCFREVYTLTGSQFEDDILNQRCSAS